LSATASQPNGLFAEDTMLYLLNQIRWAMGYEHPWQKGDRNLLGLLDQVRRERP
jgi:hypothetical protein